MTPSLRLARRISMALGIGRQTSSTDEMLGTPTTQIALPGAELRSDVPHLQLFGFASRPGPGTDHVIVFQAGDRGRGVSIASGVQVGRPTDLAEGEVCIFHPSTGSRVWLKNDGSISIVPANGKVSLIGSLTTTGPITAPEVVINGIDHSTHEHTNGNGGGNTGAPVAG